MFTSVPNPHSMYRETLGALQPSWECCHCWIWAPDFFSTAAQRELISWAHAGMGQWTKSSWKEVSARDWQQGRACWPLQVAHTPWKAADLLLHCKAVDSPTFLLGKAKGKQYFEEFMTGCEIKPFMRQASASSEAPYGSFNKSFPRQDHILEKHFPCEASLELLVFQRCSPQKKNNGNYMRKLFYCFDIVFNRKFL